jgi:MFS family permease
MNFLGISIGTLISPYLIDHFGRRKPIIISIAIYCLLLIISTFSKDINIMLIFIFSCGLTNLISHISIFILLNEVTRKENRSQYSALLFNSFALFGIIYVWEFYYFKTWKNVLYINSTCCLILLILAANFIKESPRFLLFKKDKIFKDKILKRIFNYAKEYEFYAEDIDENNKKRFLRDNENNNFNILKIGLLDKTSEDEDLCKVILENINKNRNENVKNSCEEIEESHPSSHYKSASVLITNRNIKYIFLTLCFMWFCISGSYYGLLILAKNIQGDIYMTYSAIFTLEIVSNIIACIMMEHPHLGRKKSFIFLYFISITMITLYLCFDLSNYFIIFLTVLRFFISVIYDILYVYSTEFYSTDIRAKGLAFNALFGRISSIFIPFIVEILGENFLIYCLILFIICICLCFILKETHDMELEQYTKIN